MRRWFAADKIGSVDQVGGFSCLRARLLDFDPAMGLDASSYQFTDLSDPERYVGISAYETTCRDIEKYDGGGCVNIVIGGEYVWNMMRFLKQKSWFRFSGSDLDFFRYLGSGMAASQYAVEMPLYGRAIYNAALGYLPGLSEAALPQTQWGPVLCVCPGRGVAKI